MHGETVKKKGLCVRARARIYPSPDKHAKILVGGFRLNLVLDICIKYC